MQSRRDEWTIRLIEESKNAKFSYFITLTYDDESVDLTYGNVSKEHLQLFFKKLRKKLGKNKVRYYAVGEYGTKTYRPHYHLIMVSDIVLDSVLVGNVWQYGHNFIGTVTPSSMSYVAKYHVNKTDYPAGLEKPFVLMSKGIGRNYVNKMQDYHAESVERAYYSDYEVKKKLPRYWKNKLYSDVEREQIRLNLEKTTNNMAAMEKWLKKHPKHSYFADLQARYEEHQRLFNQKSKINQKL